MFTSVNPYSSEHYGTYPALGMSELLERIRTAESTYHQFWRPLSLQQRSDCIIKLGDLLTANRDQLARDITLEMGKPISQSIAEIEKCAWLCRYAAATAAEHLAVRTVRRGSFSALVAHEPLGGLLGIMPWNFPYWQAFRFAVPALLAGNVALVKPAPNVPRCGLNMERLFGEAIGEPGVFQTLLIDHPLVEEVIAHPFIAGVALTGSERAGSAVAAAAGRHLKKCILELGGSDAFIVLEDADVEAAARAAVASRMNNNGQTCIAAKRLIVHQDVAESFTRALLESIGTMENGDPLSMQTRLSCLARPDLATNLQRQVDQSLQLGALPLLEGGLIDGSETRYRPWVLSHIPPASPAATEELFGPVACLFTVPNADAAISLANASSYGLGAAIWSRETDKAVHLARNIQAGAIAVNGMVASDPRVPFGGVKRSGYGRELGHEGFLEFVNTQSVTLHQ